MMSVHQALVSGVFNEDHLKKSLMIGFTWWWILVGNEFMILSPSSQGWLSQIEDNTSPPRSNTASRHWYSGIEATSWWEWILKSWQCFRWMRSRGWSTISRKWKPSRIIFRMNPTKSSLILSSILSCGINGSLRLKEYLDPVAVKTEMPLYYVIRDSVTPVPDPNASILNQYIFMAPHHVPKTNRITGSSSIYTENC